MGIIGNGLKHSIQPRFMNRLFFIWKNHHIALGKRMAYPTR